MIFQVAQRIIMVVLLMAAPSTSRPSKCSLPLSWHGDWFHSGVTHPVTINHTAITFKGSCLQSDKDRYLIRDSKHGCYRCLVIHQKHHNVLQYKETYCDRTNSLEYMCQLLAGDSQLHSLFRLGAAPVPCPFPHTYTFTYTRGHGECIYPRSAIDQCTDDWRLLLRYQACPDVLGTESTIEELECLATWKDGSNHYLVGKSNHPLASRDADRYRCYVYDAFRHHNSTGFLVAQSGDATCNGLFSVTDGSRTLRLTKVESSIESCRYPVWVGGPRWFSLDGGTTLHVTRHNSTLRMSGPNGAATHQCLEPAASSRNSATYVTKVTHGCTSGYQCIHMLTRDAHVLEIIMGSVTNIKEEACGSAQNFNISSTNYIAYFRSNAESRSCPGIGRYQVKNILNMPKEKSQLQTNSLKSISIGELGFREDDSCERQYTSIIVGCAAIDILEINTKCSRSVYSCGGWWEEAGRQYVVVTPVSRSSGGVRRLCFVLEHLEEGNLALASSSTNCDRDVQPGRHGMFAINSTNIGGCQEVIPESVSSTSRAPRNLVCSSSSLFMTTLFLLIPTLLLGFQHSLFRTGHQNHHYRGSSSHSTTNNDL